MEQQYFEICIGDGPKESYNDIWMCIRGISVRAKIGI